MKTTIQDQWFSPGDKVMEVDVEAAMEKAVLGYRDIEELALTKKGVIYCVKAFQAAQYPQHGEMNGVWLVGVDCGPDGLFAAEFRRVEEIRLCVNAAKKAEEPVKIKTPTTTN